VSEHYLSLLFKFLGLSFVAFLALMLGAYGMIKAHLMAPTVGYLLSFFFVGSNFLVLRNFHALSDSDFYKRFFISLGVRFVLVIVVFVVVLLTIKIHQIYFTISFIISYIFHSLIEIISITKLPETDN
jgi:hypothetical protein